MRLGKRTLAGNAYLETDHLLFRGDQRVKIAFKDLTSVTAKAGVLRLEFAGGPAELDLGNVAEKWAAKILHPPSRADKLGVKAGTQVRLVGEFDAGFLEELQALGASMVERGDAVVFYAAEQRTALKRISKLAPGGNGALWVIYPKGSAAIREIEVIEAGREAGLKDVKVASFSATHTALKFVVPVSRR
jgi:hypothetical protein